MFGSSVMSSKLIGAFPSFSLASLGINTPKPHAAAALEASLATSSRRLHFSVHACQTSTDDTPSPSPSNLTRSSSLPELPPLLHTPVSTLQRASCSAVPPSTSNCTEVFSDNTRSLFHHTDSSLAQLLDQETGSSAGRIRPRRRRSRNSTSALRRAGVLQGQEFEGESLLSTEKDAQANRVVSVFWPVEGAEGPSDREQRISEEGLQRSDAPHVQDSWQVHRDSTPAECERDEAGSGTITPEEPPFETTFHDIARRLHLWGGRPQRGSPATSSSHREAHQLAQPGCAQAYLEQEIPCLPELVTKNQGIENASCTVDSRTTAAGEGSMKQQRPQRSTKSSTLSPSNKAPKSNTLSPCVPDLGVILADIPRPPPGREKHLPVPLPFYEIVVGSANPESSYVCTATDFHDPYDWDEPGESQAPSPQDLGEAAAGEATEEAVDLWELPLPLLVKEGSRGSAPLLGLDLGELERINDGGKSVHAQGSECLPTLNSPRRKSSRRREGTARGSWGAGVEGSIASTQGTWGTLPKGVPFKEPPLSPSSQAFRELVLGEPHIPDPHTWRKGDVMPDVQGVSGGGGTGRGRSGRHTPRASRVSQQGSALSEPRTQRGDESPWDRIMKDAEGLSRLAGGEQGPGNWAAESAVSDPWAQSAFCSHEAQELLDLASLSSLSFGVEKRGRVAQGMASLALDPESSQASGSEEEGGESEMEREMQAQGQGTRRRRRRKNLLRRPWLNRGLRLGDLDAATTSSDAEAAMSGSDVGETDSEDDEAEVPVSDAELAELRVEIEQHMAAHGRVLRMPTRQELRADGPRGLDLEKWIQRLGGLHRCSATLGIPMAHGRRPRGYWQVKENIQDEIVEFQQEHRLPLSEMPTRTLMEAKGRYDLARALEKWGGHAEVASMLGLSVRVERPKGLTLKGPKGRGGMKNKGRAIGGQRGSSGHSGAKGCSSSGDDGVGSDAGNGRGCGGKAADQASDCEGGSSKVLEGKRTGPRGRQVKGPMKALLPSRTKKWFTLQLKGPAGGSGGELQPAASDA